MAGIATAARIARITREEIYVTVANDNLNVLRPDARDGFDSITPTFFDLAAHANIVNNERASFLMSARRIEAAELDELLTIGVDIQLAPTLPLIHMIDQTTGFDRIMILKGLSIDHGSQRNSVEVMG